MVRLWILLASCLAAVTQQFTEEQKRFLATYSNLLEISDLRRVNEHVARNPQIAEDVLGESVNSYLNTGEIEKLDEVRVLATALDKNFGGERFLKRLQYIEGLEGSLWDRRQQGITLLAQATGPLYDEAVREKDAGSWRRAAGALGELLATAFVKSPG